MFQIIFYSAESCVLTRTPGANSAVSGMLYAA